MTGVPAEVLEKEIEVLLGTPKDSVNTMTLEQLRSVMLHYLETVHEEMSAQLEAQVEPNTCGTESEVFVAKPPHH